MTRLDPDTSYASQRRVLRSPGRRGRFARRLLGIGVFLGACAAVFAVVALSLHLKLGPGTVHARTTASGATLTGNHKPHRPRQPALMVKVSAVAALLAPASRIAAVPFGAGGALFLGGYGSSGAPTNTMQTLAGASVQPSGTMPGTDASAVAAALASSVYLFGGIGSTIYQITPTATTAVGSLPTATADAAIATVGGTAYVIGGYNGASELNTIVAFTPPASTTVVATLPVALRYAAATSIHGQIYIVGGDINGAATKTVYRFDPTSRTVTRFTTLPHAREREAVGALDGRIVVAGGVNTASGLRTRAIYVINPHSGAVHQAGRLPLALSDMTAVEGPKELLIAGGLDGAGAATATIYAITAKHR